MCVCFDLLSNFSFKTFLILRRKKPDVINVCGSFKIPVVLARFQWNVNFSQRIVEKYGNMKFHENPSIGSRDPCGRTDGSTDRDVTKLRVAFCNFANAPKNTCLCFISFFLSPLSPSFFLMFTDSSWSFTFHPLIWAHINPTCIKLFCFVKKKKTDSISVRQWQHLLSIL